MCPSVRRVRASSFALAVLAFAVAAHDALAQSPEYRFKLLASTSSSNELLAAALIDDTGRVAYELRNMTSGYRLLLRSELDGTTTMLADTSGQIADFLYEYREMNNSGAVVFLAVPPPGSSASQAVYVADGNALVQVATNTTLPSPMQLFEPGCNAQPLPPCVTMPSGDPPSFIGVSINDFGHVALCAIRSCNGKSAILEWDGTAFTTALSDAPIYLGLCYTCPSGALMQIDDMPRINNAGTIAFTGRVCGTASGLGCLPASYQAPPIVGKTATAGSFLVLARDDDPITSSYAANFLRLNNSGDVVYRGGCTATNVVKASGGVLTVLATGMVPWGFNDSGQVLMSTSPSSYPVFTTGPDVVNDRVLGSDANWGDPLFGSRVRHIHTSLDPLNNAGEVALIVELLDGRKAVVRAEPIGDPVGTSYCEGSSGCPCGNNSAVGSGRGCANANLIGARLVGHGSASLAADDLWFTADFLTGGSALLFAGTTVVSTPLGEGLKCVGGAIRRLGVMTPDAQLEATWGSNLAASGGWSAGDTRRFQVWYRNGSQSPCAGGSDVNFSNAVEVTFTP